MRHFVMVRSCYGAGEANERRLAFTRGITARSLDAQTNRDWELVVLLDDEDPLRAERLAVFEGIDVPVRVIRWRGQSGPRLFVGQLADEREAKFHRKSATAYRVNWGAAIDSARGRVLMTRLDDDDALTPDALARTRAAAEECSGRAALMQPNGFVVWHGRYSRWTHPTNAMHSLLTPDGDPLTVYDYGHRHLSSAAPVRIVDEARAWLWVRHPDTISGGREATRPIHKGLMDYFPIDWSLVA